MVAAVAALEPELAANIAQAAMLVCMSPPGSQLTHASRARYMRSETPDRKSSSPMRMNSGAATRMKLVLTDHDICPKVPSQGYEGKQLAEGEG